MNNFSIGFVSGLGLILVIKLAHYVISDLIDIDKKLKEFEKRAIYGPKEDVYNLRYDLTVFCQNRIYHVVHGNRAKNIWKIIDTRQRYEK